MSGQEQQTKPDGGASVSTAMLGARHVALLRKIVEEQELVFPSCGKLLDALHKAGFIFVHESSGAMWGDKSVKVRSAIAGEDYLEEVDSAPND